MTKHGCVLSHIYEEREWRVNKETFGRKYEINIHFLPESSTFPILDKVQVNSHDKIYFLK